MNARLGNDIENRQPSLPQETPSDSLHEQRGTVAISSFPNPFPGNPYLDILYRHLAQEGILYVRSGHFGKEWLFANRGRVDWIHIHWPGYVYSDGKGGASLLKASIYVAKLWLARILGYRIVWTLHNLYPHNRRRNWKEWLARALIVHSVNTIVLTFPAAREDVRRFGRRGWFPVIPIGNFRPVYPVIPDRLAARSALAIDPHAYVFLVFGGITPYKGAHAGIEAMRRIDSPTARLFVVGQCLEIGYRQHLETLAAEDPRVRLELGRNDIPDELVALWMSATDCVVAPYESVYTSGVLYLAATFEKPIVTPNIGMFATLSREDFVRKYDWLTPQGIAETMNQVMITDQSSLARSARRFADAHEWKDIARRFSAILKGEAD